MNTSPIRDRDAMTNPRAAQITAAMLGYLATKHETPEEKRARFREAARRKRARKGAGTVPGASNSTDARKGSRIAP